MVSATTERWYGGLPEFYRVDDAAGDWPLLRFLSLVGDQAGEVETIVDRVGFVSEADGGAPGDTSDLADPAAADAAWLPWLAQLVGVDADAVDLNTVELRAAIVSASTGWRAGSKASIAAAVRPILTGGQSVEVADHTDVDPWIVEVRVRSSENPGGLAAVVDAIERARVKPAGVEIVVGELSATWATIEAARPTWDDWDGSTWTEIEETT